MSKNNKKDIEQCALHDVSNFVFSITEQQLEQLIEKVHKNIEKITRPKGEYCIGFQIQNSTEATIKNFLKKHCC